MEQHVSKKLESFRDIAEIAESISLGVVALHEAKIIHRDLKPANVVLTQSGMPKVTDFSIAKILGSPTSASTVGQIVGSLNYMAPEQTDEFNKEFSPATDVYGIGAILYALVAGQAPFDGANQAAVIHAIRYELLTPPSKLRRDVPRDLETICLKCLEKEPRHRYASAREVADDLHRFANMQSISARRTPIHISAWRWCRRKPTTAALLFVLAAAICTTAWMSMANWREHRRIAARQILENILSSDPEHLPTIAQEVSQVDKSLWAGQFDLVWASQPPGSPGRSRLMLLEPTRWLDWQSDDPTFPTILHPEEALVVIRSLSSLDEIQRSRVIDIARKVVEKSTSRTQRLGAAAVLASTSSLNSGQAASDRRRDRVAIKPPALIGHPRDTGSNISQTIARDLVESSSLEAGRWAEQFIDVKDSLAGPVIELAREANNPTESSRALALDLGWQWSQGNIERMSQILMASPSVRTPQLLATIGRNDSLKLREKIRHMYDDLSIQALSPKATPISNALSQLVTQVQGTISKMSCILPLIPLDQWGSYRTQFQSEGFWPRCVRPADISTGRIVAAIFDRTDEPTEVDFEITEQQLQETIDRRTQDDWQPISLSVRKTPDGSHARHEDENDSVDKASVFDEVHFTIVWRKSETFRSKLDFYADDASSWEVPDTQWQHAIAQAWNGRLFKSAVLRSLPTTMPEFPDSKTPIDLFNMAETVAAVPNDYGRRDPIRGNVPLNIGWNFANQNLHPISIDPIEPQEHTNIAASFVEFGFEPQEVVVVSDETGNLFVSSYWMNQEPQPSIESVHQTAQAAFLCWMLDDDEPVSIELNRQNDRSVGTRLIASISSAKDQLIARWPSTIDSESPDVVYAFLLVFGNWSDAELSSYFQAKNLESLAALAQSHTNAAVHSAAQWLLRRIGTGSQPNTATGLATVATESEINDLPHRSWFTNPSGITFSVVDVNDYQVLGPDGAVPWNSGPQQYSKSLKFAFAISTTEVTNVQFQEFLADVPELQYASYTTASSPHPAGPCTTVTYWMALKFCRWLSEKEGIPEDQMCLPPIDQIGPGLSYTEERLSRTGYRLPTDAEWEVACRAASRTSRFFGRESNFLEDYAWIPRPEYRTAHPIGQLKPNPWGLFDILGNVYEWCLNPSTGTEYSYAESKSVQLPLNFEVRDTNTIYVQGGSFLSHPQYCTAGATSSIFPQQPDANIGFRIVRTLRPVTE